MDRGSIDLRHPERRLTRSALNHPERAVRVLCERGGIRGTKATCWLVLMAGMIVAMASVPWGDAQSLPSSPPVQWPDTGVMATLTAKITRPSVGRMESHSEITFGDIPTRFSPPGATVTFPFRAVLEDDSKCGFGIDFNVTVWRRGPALPMGIPQSLQIIGQKKVPLSLPEERPPHEQHGNCLYSRGPLRHTEQTLDVTVTLPGGVNLVEIVADIDFGPGNEALDVRKEFPSKACEQPAFDNDCMLIAVAPTAVVIPGVIPLTILYEPPGNCSYAMIKQTHSAGVQMALTEAGAENRKALIDIRAAITNDPITQSNTEQHQVNSLERISRFEFSAEKEWSTAGTEEKACKNYSDYPERHGPGLGDMLIFLTNPQFFYWDTAGLSNYRYPVNPENGVPPGQPEPLPQFAFAWELRNFLLTDDERWLPPFLQGATKTQIRRLASLNPFIRLPPAAPPKGDPSKLLRPVPEAQDCLSLDPQDIASAVCVRDVLKDTELDKQRFVKIDATCIPEKQTHLSDIVAETNNRSASSISKISEEEPGKTTLQSAIEGVAFVGGAAAKAAEIKGITPELIEEELNAVTRGYTDKSVITTTVTMTRNEGIKTVEGNRYTQTLRLLDEEDPHACVAFYYDKIFGTIATKRLPGGSGVFRQAAQGALSTKDQLIEMAAIIGGREGTVPLSQGNLDLLTSQADGTLSFALAPNEDYQAAEGTVQGLPAGLTLDPSTGDLSGTAVADSEQLFQALVVVRDASGGDMASIWMNLTVVPGQTECFDPNVPLTCTGEVRDDGSAVETCCSAPGCCRSAL